MTPYRLGDKSHAICKTDGRFAVTFLCRTIDCGVQVMTLVGVCDVCGEVVSIPAQSSREIQKALEKQSDKPSEA